MAAGHGIQETLRDVTLRDVTLRDVTLREIARRDGPGRAVAAADVAAWERAEGWGSEAAAAAVARRGIERWIPGLPARRTYKVLGWMAMAAILVDGALAWAPPSAGIDTADTWVRYGTAIVFVAAAAWSLLSEVRGWEGSDAATWFLKARVKRHETRLAARRRALRDTVVAVGADGLAVYRHEGGRATHETLAPEAILDLALEAGAGHMTLRLTTAAGTRRFAWLPRDPAFEAAVARLAGAADSGSAAPVEAQAGARPGSGRSA